MRDFIIFSVFIATTLIIGLSTLLASGIFDSSDSFELGWIFSTVIASASITISMIIMGKL